MHVVDEKMIEGMLGGISMRGTRFEGWDFEWEVCGPLDIMDEREWTNEGFLVRCSFERPDAVTGKMARGWGRHWWVDRHSSPEQVVFTAWLAIKQVVDHELHESFVVNMGGEQVKLLDPHKSLGDLAVGSARVPDAGEADVRRVPGTGRVAAKETTKTKG